MEYMEDVIEKDPMAAYPPEVLDGTVVFQGTGDKLIDKWERDIAAGKKLEFEDDFAGADEVKRWLEKGKKPATEADLPDGFSDDYTKENVDG